MLLDYFVLQVVVGTGTAGLIVNLLPVVSANQKKIYNKRCKERPVPHPSESPTIHSMRLQGTIEESCENDLALPISWQEIAEHSTNIAIFESVIKEFTVRDSPWEDKLPDQLSKAARTILKISWDIEVNYTNSSLLTYSYNQKIFTLVSKEPQRRF